MSLTPKQEAWQHYKEACRQSRRQRKGLGLLGLGQSVNKRRLAVAKAEFEANDRQRRALKRFREADR